MNELKTMRRIIEHSQMWYASTLSRLREWSERLPERQQKELQNILSNGKARPFDPPSLQELVSLYKFRAEDAEIRVHDLEKRIAELEALK